MQQIPFVIGEAAAKNSFNLANRSAKLSIFVLVGQVAQPSFRADSPVDGAQLPQPSHRLRHK